MKSVRNACTTYVNNAQQLQSYDNMFLFHKKKPSFFVWISFCVASGNNVRMIFVEEMWINSLFP